MVIVKWAAIGITVLMGLANLGQIAQETSVGWKVLGLVLAFAALVAVAGFAARKPWGATAVIAVAAVNLVGAVIGAITGQDGWPVGLVLSVLGIVLGAVYLQAARPAVVA